MKLRYLKQILVTSQSLQWLNFLIVTLVSPWLNILSMLQTIQYMSVSVKMQLGRRKKCYILRKYILHILSYVGG